MHSFCQCYKWGFLTSRGEGYWKRSSKGQWTVKVTEGQGHQKVEAKRTCTIEKDLQMETLYRSMNTIKTYYYDLCDMTTFLCFLSRVEFTPEQ